MLSLASELVADYNVKIIDQRVDSNWKLNLKKYIQSQPICVAFSAMTGLQIRYALEAAKFVRDIAGKSISLVWGGVHPSMMADQTLDSDFVDIILRGEGENNFKILLNAIKANKELSKIKGISYKQDGKKIHNLEGPLTDMEKLKPLPWNLINVKRYIDEGSLMFEGNVKRMLDIGVTSRGCPHGCTFCYNLFFNRKKWRGVPAKKTFENIKQCVDDFNLDGVWLHDDNYFVDLKRVSEVADLMIKDRMDIKWTNSGITLFSYKGMDSELKNKVVKSGCNSFRFGIETANPRIIKMIGKPNTKEDIFAVNKDTKKYDITPIYSFMAGFPTETKKEILETCKAMVRLKRENKKSKFHVISIYTPYPGTPLFDLAIKNGFKPPTTFKGWSSIYWGSKDASVSLCDTSREYLNNIQDISYLTSDWFSYVVPKWLNLTMIPVKFWLNFRWKNQLFNFAPELKLYRKIYRLAH